MEDCDWTDLPSTSSAVLDIDNINYTTDTYSSPELSEIKKGQHENKDEGNNTKAVRSSSDADVKNKNKGASNDKREKESCPICLSSFEDRSFLDQCFHSFCFCCILQWCEVVQTCPLCKAGFGSVIHNVKSMQNYEQYVVEKKKKTEQASNGTGVRHAEPPYDERGFNEHGERFRYRTTRSSRTNNENSNQRSEQRPELAASRQSRRENWGNEATRRRRSRHTRARFRGIEKRRQVYAFNLQAESTLGRGKQRSRNISSQFFKTYQGCTHRLIPWLARDLRVLLGSNEEEVNFLMEYILSLITRIDMDSADFVEELRPFLLQTTDHFVHELLSFAKAPLDMTAYDECVVYPWPEESSHAVTFFDRENVNGGREGNASSAASTRPLTESTPLSRCAWNDTPAGLHQVSNVHDSRGSPLTPRCLQPVEVNESIEICDSTEDSERTDDENRNDEPKNSRDIESDGYDNVSRHGETRLDEYQSSLTPRNMSENLHRNSSTAKGEVHRRNIAEHVHRHIHKHVHKHKHKHRHEHKHKRKHKHKSKHKNEHESEHEHRDKREHVFKNDPKYKLICDGRALSCYSRSFVDISATQIRPSGSQIQTNNVLQVHSPELDEMRKEIEELNVLIQQHEEQLLNLTRRTES